VSSPDCDPAREPSGNQAQQPPGQASGLRRLRALRTPPRLSALDRVFERLRLLRGYPTEIGTLVRRARRFTPEVAARVAILASADPDAALNLFVADFQRAHFELDESAIDQGFELWVDGASHHIPVVMRGTDRCNGIEPLGYRSGYALQWALIQDVFFGDERAEVISEVADTFGGELADRLQSATPPDHHLLCQRLKRSPYHGIVAFSRWALGDVLNPILYHHEHHADELRLPWTSRGVHRAARLIRAANNFQAPTLALARWLEVAPAAHGRLLVDAVLGRGDGQEWNRAAMRPCGGCGFPPHVDNWQQATSEDLLRACMVHTDPQAA
jgi:hypothetical protein